MNTTTLAPGDAAIPPPEPEPVPPPGYALVRRLGGGGMGEVYAAVQTALGRTVAVKFLRPDLFGRPDVLARFRTEAAVTAKLRHPHVVQVFEAGEIAGRPYLVLELVTGGSLAEALTRGPLGPGPAADLVRTLADAVQTSHEAGVIHRDLKPANVLIAGRDPGSAILPKITDFGLAKPVDDTPVGGLTVTGAVLGSPSYMAPEQADGRKDVGPAADVYALGAILYECLTGRPPFRAAGVLETLELVRSADPVPVRQLQPAVPRDLETICLKCLRKAPGHRYASAADLAADLDRFRAGKPILARPVGRAERLAKWCRRQPAAAALLAVAIILPVIAVVAVAAHNSKLSNSLAEQTRERERADANYRAAREAIIAMLDRTADRSAAAIPQLRELERKQAEDALTFFRAVVKDGAEADPEVRFQLAEAVKVLGARTAEVGEPAAAVALEREAVAVFDSLTAAYPGDVRFRHRAAVTRGQIGFALIGTDPAAAETELGRAVAALEVLHREHPAEAEFAHRLGQFYQNLGILRRRAGNLDEAERYYRRAIAAHEEGIKAEPPTVLRRTMLADGWNGVGMVAWGTKRFADADAAFARVDTIMAEALAAAPGNLDAALTHGSMFINWGLAARDDGKPDVAVRRFDRAVEILEDVYQREPKLVRVRQPLYNAHRARASVLGPLGRAAAAADDCERAVEFAAPGMLAVVWGDAAELWAKGGSPGRALAAAAKAKAADAGGWPVRRTALEADPAFAAVRALPGWAAVAGQAPSGRQ